MRIDDFRVRADLLYAIPADQHAPDQICALLNAHPEVRFVSLTGVDIAGNDTDEKIPVSRFLEELDSYLAGGVQTDGSSVVLPCIATINDAQIDLVADLDVNWYVDYNYENLDRVSDKPWGTLRIPSFLVHNGVRVCARSVLKQALEHADETLKSLMARHPQVFETMGVQADEVASFQLVAATELEFWVRTPDDIIDKEHLSTSQTLKEQYWKRTKGIVRSALEQTLRLLELYGFAPEMGHKEVGGVKAMLHESGNMDHILEQLEIDWQYAAGLQAADNELAIRILVKEIFRLHGLEASFMAKPIQGVAGNGEHTHVNYSAVMKDGRCINLFSPSDFRHDFLSEIGYGALMGLLKHYRDLVAPFASASIDAFNRLKPGYEAPTHVAVSIGESPEKPSRNRTVLVCLVRHPSNPKATRFELRSPNPHSNMYFVMASASQTMLDGISHALTESRSRTDLMEELTREPGVPSPYLPEDRLFRTESDIFTVYSEAERDAYFGRPAATVYDTLKHLMQSDRHDVLFAGGVFSDRLLRSYTKAMTDAWELELKDRILMNNLTRIRAIKPMGQTTPFDAEQWNDIDRLRHMLAKSDGVTQSLFDRIRDALDRRDLAKTNALFSEMNAAMETLEARYERYRKNQLDFN